MASSGGSGLEKNPLDFCAKPDRETNPQQSQQISTTIVNRRIASLLSLLFVSPYRSGLTMENVPHPLSVASPSPSNSGIVRRRSLSPSILLKASKKEEGNNLRRLSTSRGVSASPSRRGPNSRPPASPSIHRRAGSSPLSGRPLLAEIHNAPKTPSPSHNGGEGTKQCATPIDGKVNDSIHISPVYLRYSQPHQPTIGPHMPLEYPQLGRTRNPYASIRKEDEDHRDDSRHQSPPIRDARRQGAAGSMSGDSKSSCCSTPSTPFMELIYSASASTTATPEIFRERDEENKETPVIRNPAVRGRRTIASGSPSSTLRSMTPRNQHQVRPEWWVPRISTANFAGSSHHPATASAASASLSPFSLPSMLGGPSTEDVSELESPMLLDYPNSTSAEESDIQSQSQATDIYSMRTTSPNATGPLVRCNAQDEEDSNSSPVGPASNPTLTQLASGSALCMSREEVVTASNGHCNYHDEENYADSEPSETCSASQQSSATGMKANASSEIAANPRLQREEGTMIPEPSAKARESYAPSTRTSRLFFRSSIPTPSPKAEERPDRYAEWYLDSNCNYEEDVEISELSSQFESSRGDIEEATTTNHSDGLEQDDNAKQPGDTNTENGTSNRKNCLAGTRWVLIFRLSVLFILALAVVIPLVVVLVYTQRSGVAATKKSNGSPNNGSPPVVTTPRTTPSPTQMPTVLTETTAPTTKIPIVDSASSTPTPKPSETTASTPTPSPSPPVSATSMPTAPSTTIATPENTAAPTFELVSPSLQPSDATTVVPTASPISSPTETSMPITPPPTLPRFTTIWNEESWNEITFRIGPIWQPQDARLLQLKVLNSLSDPEDQAVLETTVNDWQTPSSVDLTLESSPLPLSNSTAACVPMLGMIRVCNGNYGDTETKFFSQIYINGRDILAATIFVNDDFGLESLSTPASLQRNLCHELGHALGVFHSSRGCMVEALDLDVSPNQEDYLHPDPVNYEELENLYGNERRQR